MLGPLGASGGVRGILGDWQEVYSGAKWGIGSIKGIGALRGVGSVGSH